jgi:hypothetical protein
VPFQHAAGAAAMDREVDVVCTATAGKLMRKSVAEALFMKLRPARTELASAFGYLAGRSVLGQDTHGAPANQILDRLSPRWEATISTARSRACTRRAACDF